MLTESNRTLINNLKGRASKILSAKAAILRDEEKTGLEGVCAAIDDLILSNKEQMDINTFLDEVLISFKYLKGTRKEAIKKRILPVLEKLMEEGLGR